MKILVTAGHKKSRYSLAILSELLNQNNISIECVEVKTFSLKRFRRYLRQYKLETIIKKFMVHFSDNITNRLSNETLPIKEFLKNKNIRFTSIKSFCKNNNIKHYITDNLNSPKIINLLGKNDFDFVIYSGGGILRKKFIDIAKLGVLNAHSGYLPNFRGMNAIEWSVLSDFTPHTTIHFIDAGIDTGCILYTEPIPFSPDLYLYRGNAVVHNVNLLMKVLKNIDFYIQNKITQNKLDGKQYFVMHNELKKVVEKKLLEKD